MEIGKLSHSLLQKLILDRMNGIRKESILRPGIGEDCSVLDMEGEWCALSSDPITGTVHEIGTLAVHVSLNDIAATGAEPVGIITTILLPPNSTEEDLTEVFQQIQHACTTMGVDVLGGHTEVTDAVSRTVIITTAVGRVKKDRMVSTRNARPKDAILVTGRIGAEGAAILAYNFQDELEKAFGNDFVERTKAFLKRISVVEEGRIGASLGAHSMHDITEGGILGAVWEICHASETGCIIQMDRIPIAEETRLVCGHFGLDPYRLMSSGCMLITLNPERADTLIKVLMGKGIQTTVIGHITEQKTCFVETGAGISLIHPPGADELYRAGKTL